MVRSEDTDALSTFHRLQQTGRALKR